MTHAIEIGMDAAGRIVIPKWLRERLGLAGGGTVEVRDAGDHLEIRPRGVTVRIVTREDGPVLVADGPVAPLTDDDVRRLRDEGLR